MKIRKTARRAERSHRRKPQPEKKYQRVIHIKVRDNSNKQG